MQRLLMQRAGPFQNTTCREGEEEETIHPAQCLQLSGCPVCMRTYEDQSAAVVCTRQELRPCQKRAIRDVTYGLDEIRRRAVEEAMARCQSPVQACAEYPQI